MRQTSRRTIGFAALTALIAAALSLPRLDAAASSPHQAPAPLVQEPPAEYSGFTYVAPRARRGDGTEARTANFIVTYNGFSPEAQRAFQYAVDIWASIVRSSVPIRVTAYWRTDMPTYVLGSAGAAMMVRDFPNTPRANTYFAAALANARAGVDLTSTDEIVANFNANFPWYLGTDGNARESFDFVTVVLHEIGHGLGIFGSMRVANGVGAWGAGGPAAPLAYDLFVTDGAGRSLVRDTLYPNNSAALAAQLVSASVYFDGRLSRSAANGVAPALFAPNPWVPGSSIAHLDASAYPPGDPNSLMTPSIAPGRVVHDPGTLTTGLLADMGWSLSDDTTPPASLPRAPTNVRMRMR